MSPLHLLSILALVAVAAAYPAVPSYHHNDHEGHVHKRQSYARSNQLPAPSQEQYYGQASYNNYNYNGFGGDGSSSRRNYYGSNGPPPSSNGYYSNAPQNAYYDHPPSQHYYREPLQGSYANVNPIQREITVRNGQMRQKEYQQRTGQEGRDTYDPFYFYVNPVAAAQAQANNGGGPPPPPPLLRPLASSPQTHPSSSSSGALPPSPTTVTASITSQGVQSSREHSGGPPRNRRNSLNVPPSRDPYFDNEISGDKYEILTSKPTYSARLQNQYPGPPSQQHNRHNHHLPPQYATSRYSSGVQPNPYRQPPGNPNQFLNYEQIVGAEPPRYANNSPSRGGQPWSIQIGTQLKVNDDGKGGNSGSRFYVRDERNTRSRQPPYHRK